MIKQSTCRNRRRLCGEFCKEKSALVRRIRWKSCGNWFVGSAFGNKGSLRLFFEVSLFALTIKGVKRKAILLLPEIFSIIHSYATETIDRSMPVSNRRHVMQSKGKFERPCDKAYCVGTTTKQG